MDCAKNEELELIHTQVTANGPCCAVWMDDTFVHVRLWLNTMTLPKDLWEDYCKIISLAEKKRLSLQLGDVDKLREVSLEIHKREIDLAQTMEETCGCDNPCDCEGCDCGDTNNFNDPDKDVK